MMSGDEDRPRRRGGNLLDRIGDAAGVLLRVAASAGELLADRDLRRRGAALIIDEASKGLQELQKGIEEGANNAVELGVRRVQAVLQDIEAKVAEFQEQQRARDAAVEADRLRRRRVDVQLGAAVFEDAAPDMRGRLWTVIAQRPDLTGILRNELQARMGHSPEGDSPPERARRLGGGSSAASGSGSTLTGTGSDSMDSIRPCAPASGCPSTGRPSGEWQVLPLPPGATAPPPPGSTPAPPSPRTAALDASRVQRAALLEAMHAVPWDEAESMPAAPTPADEADGGADGDRSGSSSGGRDGKAAAAAAAAASPGVAVPEVSGAADWAGGVDEWEAVEAAEAAISRDLDRTFPEHPMFRAGDGQARLERLLRAYAAHDPEVAYCQGMAFPAGMLLMAVPEATALALYRQLMDPRPRGAGLRRLYLPGLEYLKLELAAFELLVASHLPALHAHLQATGVSAVLYCSSWYMTGFALGLPHAFAARALDILLQAGADALPRIALALMEALEGPALAGRRDFEATMTAIKVTPLTWSPHKLRRILDRAVSPGWVGDAQLEGVREIAAAQRAAVTRSNSLAPQRAASSGERPEAGDAAAEGGPASGPLPGVSGVSLTAGRSGSLCVGSIAGLEGDLEAVLQDLSIIAPRRRGSGTRHDGANDGDGAAGGGGSAGCAGGDGAGSGGAVAGEAGGPSGAQGCQGASDPPPVGPQEASSAPSAPPAPPADLMFDPFMR